MFTVTYVASSLGVVKGHFEREKGALHFKTLRDCNCNSSSVLGLCFETQFYYFCLVFSFKFKDCTSH